MHFLGLSKVSKHPPCCCCHYLAHEPGCSLHQETCNVACTKSLPVKSKACSDAVSRFLPKATQIIGYARTALTHDGLRERLAPFLKGDPEQVDRFLQLCTYHQGDVSDANCQHGSSSSSPHTKANSTTNRLVAVPLVIGIESPGRAQL